MGLPVAIFLLTSFLIGIHSASRVAGKVRNFYVAGNIIPFWVLAFSMIGQAVELGGTQDNATLAMTSGFWAGALLPVGIGLSLIMIGLFFAEPLHKMRLLTLPDFYYKRYDSRVELMVSVISLISFMILIAGNLAGVGIVLHFTLGIERLPAMIIVAVPVMIYTMAGGLFAVTWNDVLHVGVIIVGFASAFIWLALSTGVDTIAPMLSEEISLDLFVDLEGGALGTWAALLALALGDIVALDFMERVFAAKTPRFAKLSCLIAGITVIVLGLGLAVVGVIAARTFEIPEAENVFLAFVQKELPAGIATMVFMAVVAACLSTIDGCIMACSVVVTNNILKRQFPNFVTKEKLLYYSRLSAIPVTIGAIIIAVIRPVPGDLLVLAFDVVFAGCLVPLALGIYWKRGTTTAAYWSILVPSILRVVLYLIVEEFAIPEWLRGLETLIPPLVSLFLYVAITICSKEEVSKEEGAHA